MYPYIESRNNDKVKHAVKVAQSASFRDETGLFFAEGLRLCEDLAMQYTPKRLFCTETAVEELDPKVREAQEVYIIDRKVMHKLSETKRSQGVFCLFETPSATLDDIDTDKDVLLCERVQDPGNVGTMIRSAAAFDLGGVVLTPGCADPFSAKALRASMGAIARIPIVSGVETEAATLHFANQGVTVLASDLHNGIEPEKLSADETFLLMIGNEGAGLSREATIIADEFAHIPMANDVESLNAAAAAAVLMYGLKRR